MSADGGELPPVTIVIEWENAIDTQDRWARSAVAGLERELCATAPRMAARPVISYLYDSEVVDPEAIRRTLRMAAPRLADVAEVEIVPAPGLSYYELKNIGVARARTELSIILDSDAAPQPGWLEAMIAPFSDPAIMAVGGITVMGYDDLLSRTFALIWIFGLIGERHRTAGRRGIYANNTAVRSAFLRDRPFPRLTAFKKQCVFWLRGMLADGHGYVRVADAVTIHAPHPGYRFIVWRAWITGRDRDFHAFHLVTRSRLGRTGHAAGFFATKLGRAWWRIVARRREVGLPLWQAPAAMAIALGFFSIALAGQLVSAIARRYDPLPDGVRRPSGVAQPVGEPVLQR